MIPEPAPTAATPPGTIPLFAFRGIHVFLHWTWLLVAIWQIDSRRGLFPHVGWDIALYISLFAIVLLHEFGHSFATRQVGGTADRILLWPFGGIAYVKTPPRPGAYLWAIVAGPLVNVVLWPVFYFASNYWLHNRVTDDGLSLTIYLFLYQLYLINTVLIIFNLLPIYPMDGGQIFRALLWFKLGPLRSMYIAAWTGLVLGGAGVLYVLIAWQAYWLAIMVGLMLQQCWATIESLKAWRAENGGRW